VARPDTQPTMRGTEFHDMAASYAAHLMVNQLETDWEWADKIATLFHGEAKQLFLDWVKRQTFQPENIVDVESTITLDWNFKPVAKETESHLAPWQGTLDMISFSADGTEADIEDYKTSWMAFSPDTIQSMYYPWLLSKVFPGLKKIRFHLNFVRWNIRKTREFLIEEMPAVEQAIFELVKRLNFAIETKQWPAITNPYCPNCVLECPLVKAGITRKMVGQIDGVLAQQIAEELFAMESQSTYLKGILRNYVADQGPITLTHHILGFKKKIKTTYPVKQVTKLNSKYGFEPVRALRADSQEIKKIGKRYPDYVSELAKLGVDRSTTDFAFLSLEKEVETESEAEDV